MSIRKPIICLIAAAAVLIAGAEWHASRSAPAAVQRIVAIGDIHGDLDAFIGILRRAGLVDPNQQWSGRDATLVQTGDFLDRGPKSRAVMDFLMALQKDAPRQKGRVTVLLGNHEMMNIIGDLRYVLASDYASFADARSEQRRKSAHEAYARLWQGVPPQDQEKWMASHPPGFVEHREAFGPNGKYGRWLRGLSAVAKVDDTIFLHGGISVELAGVSLEKLNEGIANEIKFFDVYKKSMAEKNLALPFATLEELMEAAQRRLSRLRAERSAEEDLPLQERFVGLGNWWSVHPDGPLWFRGYAGWSDEQGPALISRLTDVFKVARFVVGHTTQAGEIRSRFNGKVYIIDTGMLSSYYQGGRASALEIQNGKLNAIYMGETKTLE